MFMCSILLNILVRHDVCARKPNGLVLIHEDILVISITGNAEMQKVISDRFSPFSHVITHIFREQQILSLVRDAFAV